MALSVAVGVDGEPSGWMALTCAARLAAALRTRLQVFHVDAGASPLAVQALDEAGLLLSGSPGNLSERWRRALTQRAGAVLEEVPRRLAAAGGDPSAATVTLLQGEVARRLEERAAAEGAQLLVVGSHGRGPVRRALMGSVAQRLVEHAPMPVLVARSEGVSQLLVGVDGGAAGVRAAALAGRLARAMSLPLSLVMALELAVDSWLAERAPLERALRQRAAARLDEAATAVGVAVADHSKRLVFHEPSHALLAEASRSGADLLVVGRRSVSDGAPPRLGSVSRRVALSAPVSVLVVP